jgi:choline monooxygenase
MAVSGWHGITIQWRLARSVAETGGGWYRRLTVSLELTRMTETLPANWYVDPAIQRRERTAIFARNWCLFGPEAEFANLGDYRATTINGWPLFIIRGHDGTLRGFHNVCRHRAAQLLADGDGNCNMVRCPYHAWSYDLEGRLKAASDFGDDPDFNFGDYGLFPLRVETWNGLVFFCIDQDTDDLMTWLGDIPALCEPFPGPAEFGGHHGFTVNGAANWKTYCDNTVEGYHLSMIHPRLSRAVIAEEVVIEPHHEGRLVAFHVKYQAQGDTLRGADGLWFYRFPGFQATLSARGFKAERIEPVGPVRLRSTNWNWFGDLSEAERGDALDWAKEIVLEDLGVCETVQRNLEVGVYTTGILSPARESNTMLFQALVRDAVNGE